MARHEGLFFFASSCHFRGRHGVSICAIFFVCVFVPKCKSNAFLCPQSIQILYPESRTNVNWGLFQFLFSFHFTWQKIKETLKSASLIRIYILGKWAFRNEKEALCLLFTLSYLLSLMDNVNSLSWLLQMILFFGLRHLMSNCAVVRWQKDLKKNMDWSWGTIQVSDKKLLKKLLFSLLKLMFTFY